MIILRENTYSFKEDEENFQKANRAVVGHGLMAGVDAGIAGILGRDVARASIKNNKLAALGTLASGIGAGYHAYRLGKNLQTSRSYYNKPGFLKKLSQESLTEDMRDYKEYFMNSIKAKAIKEKSFVLGKKGATDLDIKRAEKLLDVKFSQDYIWYLQKFGEISSNKGFITNLIPNDEHNVVECTTKAKKEYGNLLPRNSYVVGKVGDTLYVESTTGDIFKLPKLNKFGFPRDIDSSLLSLITDKL